MIERLAPPNDWPTLGLEVAAWIEEHLRHSSGEYHGQEVRLTNEQFKFLLDAYRVYPLGHEKAGRRVVRRGVMSRPKGSGKSILASFLGVAEGLGPVAFDGWSADGDPVGKPRASAFIRIMATEEQQSIQTVFGQMVEQIRMGKDEFPKVFGMVDEGLTRIYFPNNGQARPSTASASSKDGGRETFVVCDEGHLWNTPELREAYRTVRRNIAKRRDCWALECSTMFAPGEDSIHEQAYNHARHEIESHKDYGFLWDHREGPSDIDFDDEVQLLGALREAYGEAADWVPLDEIAAECRDSSTNPSEARRYFLNVRVAGDGRCIDPEVWLNRAEPLTEPSGPIGIGFDGALSEDSTALIGCTLTEPRHIFVIGLWEKPRNSDGWEVPFEEVEAAVEEAFDTYDVAMLYADRARWGARVDGWFARWPKKVKTWPATSYRRVAQGFTDLHLAVVEERITHDGNGALARHVGNAVRREVMARDAQGRKLWIASKDSPNSSHKIDAFYAAMLAHTAASEAVMAGYRPRRAQLVSF